MGQQQQLVKLGIGTRIHHFLGIEKPDFENAIVLVQQIKILSLGVVNHPVVAKTGQ